MLDLCIRLNDLHARAKWQGANALPVTESHQWFACAQLNILHTSSQTRTYLWLIEMLEGTDQTLVMRPAPGANAWRIPPSFKSLFILLPNGAAGLVMRTVRDEGRLMIVGFHCRSLFER